MYKRDEDIESQFYTHVEKKKVEFIEVRQRRRQPTATEQWKTIFPTLDIYAARAHILPFFILIFFSAFGEKLKSTIVR